MTEGEKIQYNRHLILDEVGPEGQEKLKSSKVLVVGAGGLGCPVLQYLTAAGVGTLGIVDGDTVDVSNLQRQVLYNHEDIGQKKAQVAAEKLSKLNPHIAFRVYDEHLSTENALDIFKAFDVVVDATDNFPARYLINDAAVLSDIPLVFGSIYKFEGQVSVFNFQGGPTYRCLFPTPPRPGEVPSCSEIGVIGILPGIIGCLQANEVIKIILDLGETLSGKLLSYDALKASQQIFRFKRNPDVQITRLEKDYPQFCGIKEVNEISREELDSQRTDFELLDVRTLEEREEYHIGGIHIPLDQLNDRIEELDSTRNWAVYCRSGKRSARAIEILEKKGFDPALLFNLKNGIGQAVR